MQWAPNLQNTFIIRWLPIAANADGIQPLIVSAKGDHLDDSYV